MVDQWYTLRAASPKIWQQSYIVFKNLYIIETIIIGFRRDFFLAKCHLTLKKSLITSERFKML